MCSSDMARLGAEVLACVVAFEPSEASLEKIRALRGETPSLLVVDNSITLLARAGLSALCAETGCQLIQNGENLGQARALNQGCRWAQRRGFGFALFFDQDTRVLPGFWDAFTGELRPATFGTARGGGGMSVSEAGARATRTTNGVFSPAHRHHDWLAGAGGPVGTRGGLPG